MRLSYSETPRVDYETATHAVVEYLNARPRDKDGRRIPANASAIADAIWPNHQMHAQGAGGAASRILRRMVKRGRRVAWIVKNDKVGWILLD